MDTDEEARRQAEQELEQVGIDAGMTDSRSMATWKGTWAGYETDEGHVHYFDFAPIGNDAEVPGIVA